MKVFEVIEQKDAIDAVLSRSPLLGDMEFFWTHQNENQINSDGSGRRMKCYCL